MARTRQRRRRPQRRGARATCQLTISDYLYLRLVAARLREMARELERLAKF